MTRYPPAHLQVIDDLLAGRRLWGPLFRIGSGEVRERTGDIVRDVQRAVIRGLLDEELIAPHPTVQNRYVLTKRGAAIRSEEPPAERGDLEGRS